jgi:hypothetical protein
MPVFSGTNLPPIVRLGGSSDILFSIRKGTVSVLPPRYVPRRYFEATTVMLETVELPAPKSKKIEPKGGRKDDRSRNAMRRK